MGASVKQVLDMEVHVVLVNIGTGEVKQDDVSKAGVRHVNIGHGY